MLNINPILKRFLKGLIFTLLGSGVAYSVNALPQLNLFSATATSLIVASLLALEKALPTNF